MKLQFKSEFSCIRGDQVCIRIYSTSDPIGSQRHNYRNRGEGMPVRKVINRPLLRSQRLIWRETRGQTAYRTKDLFFFPTRVLELFFFFCPPPIAGQRPKKVATNGESMGQQAGLINSVTALHGRVSFRSAICHVPKGTYKQNEAVSAQFMHDPRTWSISFYFQCLFSIRSFEVWIYWNGIFLFFFFFGKFKKILHDIYILENNCQQK